MYISVAQSNNQKGNNKMQHKSFDNIEGVNTGIADRYFAQLTDNPDSWQLRDGVFDSLNNKESCLGVLCIGEYERTTEARIYKPDGSMRSYQVWSVADYQPDEAILYFDIDEVAKVYLFEDLSWDTLRNTFKRMFDIDSGAYYEHGSYKNVGNVADIVEYTQKSCQSYIPVSWLRHHIHDITEELDIGHKQQETLELTLEQVCRRIGQRVKIIPG